VTDHQFDQDPYADTTPKFPIQDLYEVRPSGSAFKRGKGWMLVVGVVLVMGGIIAWDKWSKAKPAEAATPAVHAYGVGNIPLKDAMPTQAAEQPAAQEQAKTEEKKQERKKVAAKPLPRRKSVLGMASAFEDPSHKRAQREVSSWNPTGRNETVATRRESALGK